MNYPLGKPWGRGLADFIWRGSVCVSSSASKLVEKVR